MRKWIFVLVCISMFLVQCSYSSKFENEFKKYVSDSDKKLFDGDILHPAYAYFKNGKLRGLEFNNHPECGNYTKRYFFHGEKAVKIIIEKDYFNESCGEAFDSLYVINPIINKVMVYTKFTKGKEIKSNILENEKINLNKYKNEIENWKEVESIAK